MNSLVPRLMLVAAFTVSVAAVADAQAVARGGSSSSSSSGSSSSGSSSSGGSSGSSSSGGGSTYSAPPRTPSHSAGDSGSHRSSGGRGSSSTASSNSGSGSGSHGAAVRRTPTTSAVTTASAPTYARPSSDSRVVGYAVPRARTPYHPPTYIYTPSYFYAPWWFGSYGFGYGLSYMWDPYIGYGYPYGGYGYGGYPYGYGAGYGYGGSGYYDSSSYSQSYSQADEAMGGLRIKVKPREARVLVDGSFVGTVDDFDGVFQKVSLTPGRHHVTLQLDGYQPLDFDVSILPGDTINYKGELQKR